jgi:hypothetical protein
MDGKMENSGHMIYFFKITCLFNCQKQQKT